MALRGAMASSWLLLLVVAMSVPVGVARALSEDDERARAHFVAAEAYFEDQRFNEAAREFDEAYQLSGRPEMLLNLSRAHERAGAAAEAIADLELLLSRHPQTSYRAAAEERLAQLRAQHPEQEKPLDTPPPPPQLTLAPEPRRKLWPPRLPTLAVGGAAALSALVAVATGWAAHAKYGELDARCDGGCEPPFEDDRQRGQRLARTSTGMTFAAVALGGVTAALWVLDLRAERLHARLGLRTSLAASEARLRVDF